MKRLLELQEPNNLWFLQFRLDLNFRGGNSELLRDENKWQRKAGGGFHCCPADNRHQGGLS